MNNSLISSSLSSWGAGHSIFWFIAISLIGLSFLIICLSILINIRKLPKIVESKLYVGGLIVLSAGFFFTGLEIINIQMFTLQGCTRVYGAKAMAVGTAFLLISVMGLIVSIKSLIKKGKA